MRCNYALPFASIASRGCQSRVVIYDRAPNYFPHSFDIASTRMRSLVAAKMPRIMPNYMEKPRCAGVCGSSLDPWRTGSSTGSVVLAGLFAVQTVQTRTRQWLRKCATNKKSISFRGDYPDAPTCMRIYRKISLLIVQESISSSRFAYFTFRWVLDFPFESRAELLIPRDYQSYGKSGFISWGKFSAFLTSKSNGMQLLSMQLFQQFLNNSLFANEFKIDDFIFYTSIHLIWLDSPL